MVNIEAQRERHSKIKTEDTQKKKENPLNTVDATANALSNSIHQICKTQNNPLVGKLFKRILGFAMIFLLILSFMSTYQLTHGSLADDELGVFEFSEPDPEYTIADVMTEDGFLLKPAINSETGDRTGFSDVFIYTVEAGDTLSSIAQSFNLKKETLMAENNLWNPNRLKAGYKLRILPVDGLSHKVKKGETVDKIAKKYKVDKEKIIKQNQIEEGKTLVASSTLIVPGAKRKAPVYQPRSIGGYTAPNTVANYSGPKAVGRLIWPTRGKITQGYKSRHRAIDIAHAAKGPIYASAAGKVIKAATGWNGGYGNVIIVDHGNGMQTLYAHNEKLYVTKGQYVEQGQTIGWMGRTGRVYGRTGIHLHFEVRIKGIKYNPMSFF